MAKRRKEDALETRERILDAAIEVFDRRGVSRPSLTEIAELAGVTRGAVYGHFQNKADLFSALADRIQLPDESLCQAPLDGCMDPLGELQSRWQYMYREVMVNEQWRRIFSIILLRCEWVAENGEIHQRCSEGHDEGTRRLRSLVTAAVEVGQLPKDLDIDMAVPILHAGVLGLLQDWLMNPDAYNLAEVGDKQILAMREMLQSSLHLRKSAKSSAGAEYTG